MASIDRVVKLVESQKKKALEWLKQNEQSIQNNRDAIIELTKQSEDYQAIVDECEIALGLLNVKSTTPKG